MRLATKFEINVVLVLESYGLKIPLLPPSSTPSSLLNLFPLFVCSFLFALACPRTMQHAKLCRKPKLAGKQEKNMKIIKTNYRSRR